MKEYYFLASLLPALEIGHVPALGFSDLKELLVQNLNPEDLEKTRRFFRMIDMENMRSFWMEGPFDPRGNLTREQMAEAFLTESWPEGTEFPLYLKDFLDKYADNADRVRNFPFLMDQFLDDQITNEEDPFLRDYSRFLREMRLVLAGFRAKKLGRDISKELQYEDPTDPLVAEILAQKDAKIYEPPFEYKELKPIFEQFGDSPYALHKALYEYEFNSIVDIGGGEIFNIDRILNYMARLLLVERWLEMDVQQGLRVIDKIEKDIR